jgi:hypothetical protein
MLSERLRAYTISNPTREGLLLLLNMQKAMHGMFIKKLRKAKCKANQFYNADLLSLTVLLISIHSICIALNLCYFS